MEIVVIALATLRDFRAGAARDGGGFVVFLFFFDALDFTFFPETDEGASALSRTHTVCLATCRIVFQDLGSCYLQ